MDKKNETNCDIFNLGSGNGNTVLEVINTFEKVSQQKLNYQVGPRRAGDVIAIFANNDKAVSKLQWQPKYNLDDMLHTAWEWEKKLNAGN
jgi:UDP-glucose 4-epimerase